MFSLRGLGVVLVVVLGLEVVSFSDASSNQFEVFVASFVRVRVEVRSPACFVGERSGFEGGMVEEEVVEAVMTADFRWRFIFRLLLSEEVEE